MEEKVVARSSDKVIVRKKVGLREVEGEPVALTGALSGLASILLVAMPLNIAIELPLGMALLSAGGVATAATGAAFSILYAKEVVSEANNYSSSKISPWKAWSACLLPFGQKVKTGITRTKLYRKTEDIKELNYNPSETQDVVTHEISSRIRFTPKGAYVEQEFSASPVSMWDDAFDSTIDVHKFRKEENQVKTKYL